PTKSGKNTRFSYIRQQFVRDSPGCIDMHKVKIYQARSRRFFGSLLSIFACSVAVIALNAFQWCVQIAVMLNSQLF
ncbi:hypothetical protein A8V51_21465, partial [Yersinia pestis]